MDKMEIVHEMAELRRDFRELVDVLKEIQPATERDAGWLERGRNLLQALAWERTFSLQQKILCLVSQR